MQRTQIHSKRKLKRRTEGTGRETGGEWERGKGEGQREVERDCGSINEAIDK